MKQQPKTIQIFLPDGNPRSVKIAEITSRTVQATLIPRSKIDEAAKRKELFGVGVYYLFGENEEGAKPLIYVGESEECLARLRQHNRDKDFWQLAIVITSKTQYFTKSHVKFLEAYSAEIVNNAKRYHLENSTKPVKPHISESAEADLQDNFDTIRLLVSTLGYPVFEEMPKVRADETLECRGKKAVAKAEYTEDGMVVLSGSLANVELTSSAGPWVTGMRERLLNDGVLIREGEVFKFVTDHVFNSPSAAAAVVLARSANGWTEWKYPDGKTLDEVKRKSDQKELEDE